MLPLLLLAVCPLRLRFQMGPIFVFLASTRLSYCLLQCGFYLLRFLQQLSTLPRLPVPYVAPLRMLHLLLQLLRILQA